MEMARSMLSNTSLSQDYQEKSIDTTCYVVNRSLTLALLEKNPYDSWVGKRPSLAHIKVFGCDIFVHIPKERRHKLDSSSKKCIFIEQKDGVKGFKLWNPATRTIVYTRDVIFKEDRSTFETKEVK